MPLTSEIRLKLAATQTAANDLGVPTFSPLLELVAQLTNGVGVSQADLIFTDERTLALSGTDDLDLYGVLQSAFGATLNMAEIVAIFIVNKPKTIGVAASLGTLTVGVGTNPFLGFLTGTTPAIRAIGPGGFLALYNPDNAGLGTVTASTADILRIANSSAGISTYQIGILARSS
ncbi:MAG: hypothetical protein ACAH27_05750 [Xanthobacteraceae bacterium]